jgi:transposase
MRYALYDMSRGVIPPMLPNKPRGVPRVDDRRVPNGIFWVLRSGAPWRDLPRVRSRCGRRFPAALLPGHPSSGVPGMSLRRQ